MIFFSSDQHFYHRNVIQFCNRPFQTMEQMHDELIYRWNQTVRKEDHVFILGDFCFKGPKQFEEILSKLNGRKTLVLGNHDTGNGVKISHQTRLGIDIVTEYSIEVEGVVLKMSHFPYSGDHTENERYLDLRPKDEGGWLLHGHVHCSYRVKDKQINVGVDVWDFYPVSLSQILEIIKSTD